MRFFSLLLFSSDQAVVELWVFLCTENVNCNFLDGVNASLPISPEISLSESFNDTNMVSLKGSKYGPWKAGIIAPTSEDMQPIFNIAFVLFCYELEHLQPQPLGFYRFFFRNGFDTISCVSSKPETCQAE